VDVQPEEAFDLPEKLPTLRDLRGIAVAKRQ
jgi:hypothetical protein